MSLAAETLLSLLEAHPYLLLFPLAFLEGSLVTVCAGFLVSVGILNWSPAFALVVAADLSGDTFYYFLGRAGRRPRIKSLLARLGLTEKRLARLEKTVRRNGSTALVGAKLLDFAAVPVFIAAGLARMGYGRFMAVNLAVALPKSAALMTVGFFFGWQAERYLGFGAALATLVALAVLAGFAISKLSKRKLAADEREGFDP